MSEKSADHASIEYSKVHNYLDLKFERGSASMTVRLDYETAIRVGLGMIQVASGGRLTEYTQLIPAVQKDDPTPEAPEELVSTKEYMEINVGDFFIWHSVKVGSGSPVETEVLVTNIKVNSAGQTWITSVDQKGEECWNDLDMFCEQCTPCPKPLDWGQVRRVRLDAEMMAGLRLARQRDDDGLDDTIGRLLRNLLRKIVEDAGQ